ncbi:DNA-directed RNA polymerase [Epicoccum nigrum]|nr:DNA-directed RNA polymerase [Epicoccum nigrum]
MMLARAATRKLRRDAFALRTPALTRLADPLTLPSTLPRLCARRPSLSTHDGTRTRTRSLVTTAELHPQLQPHAPHSLDGFMQAWGSTMPSPELSRLRTWDTASPLVVHDQLSHAMPLTRGVAHGIAGDPIEMLQNLYACLRVGRLDRAALILKRLSVMYTPAAPEMVDAHNVYLQKLFEHELEQAQEQAQGESGPKAMKTVEQWFQKNMVARHIPPNAATFVTLLRAAVNFLQGDAQDRAVLALLDMANDCGPAVLEQVNTSPDLTDDEWNTIIRLQPDTFDEPPPVTHVQDMQYSSPAAVKSAVAHGLPVETVRSGYVKSVDQKGLGLSTLQKALATFHQRDSVPYPHDMEGTPEEKDRAYAYARQLQMENDGLEAAVERWREEDEKLTDMGIHGVLKAKSLQALMYNWYKDLLPLFKKQIEHAKHVTSNPTKENSTDEVNYYGPWLEMCTPERLAANTVSRIINACMADSRDGDNLKLSTLTTLIGTDVMDHINADAQTRHDRFLKTQRKHTRKQLVATLSKTPTAAVDKPDAEAKRPGGISEIIFQKTEIPMATRIKIGALCVEYLLQAARITVSAEDPKTGKSLTSTQAAFHHQMILHQGKKMGWIVPHHEVLAKLRNGPVHNIIGVRLPMIVPPKPWSSFDDGGYYTLQSRVVRQKAGDVSQRAYAAAAIKNGDMKQVLAGLDTLGKVPWQINKPVFDVMTAAWNAGEGLGGLVPEHNDLQPPPELPAHATYRERAIWGKEMKQYQDKKSGYHSQRCFQNFQLEIANAMAQEKAIYFPHSVDFRGRAYPVPPVLNHIGADICRGILKFANGKELGSVGLQWLKVHLANLAGFDKASLREREQFAMDHMDDIIDSATNPLGGRRWWAKAEDPWQCLACCMELKSAFDLPDPTRHVSQLPVHQDGTCNGLQHYAALGGDEAGARQVNLEPSDRPQDIYTGVAELVKELVEADAEKGHPAAIFIKGHISRKVVKRTVMTNVYGVTFMGAKAQVHAELKDMFPHFRESVDLKSLQTVAVYVASKIFEALGKIFNGAQEIQYWLGECGDRITTSFTPDQVRMIKDRFEGKSLVPDARYNSKPSKSSSKMLAKTAGTFKTVIIWTTPLKMPIVQPYTKDHSVKVKTALQEIIIQKKVGADSVDKRKQLQAFPPNFIHSLDATHMLLSALKCNEVGLDFAAVHDSFWTHACDIPNLNTILRDAFVRMHSEDITGRLAAEFAARYAGHMHRANVHASSKVGVRISKWRIENRSKPTETSEGIGRGYGKASVDELALEARRQELLKSDDPELRAEGEKMETPTSIWLEESDPSSLASHRMSLLGETKASEAAAPKAANEDDSKVLAEAAALEAAALEANEADHLGATSNDTKTPKSSYRHKGTWLVEMATIQVWLPLTFPPVPKKGTWDVTRLRESKYFFS